MAKHNLQLNLILYSILVEEMEGAFLPIPPASYPRGAGGAYESPRQPPANARKEPSRVCDSLPYTLHSPHLLHTYTPLHPVSPTSTRLMRSTRTRAALAPARHPSNWPRPESPPITNTGDASYNHPGRPARLSPLPPHSQTLQQPGSTA